MSPQSKIVFLTENRSYDFAEAALQAGASGYVVKSAAAIELFPAVKVALGGGQFISPNLMAPTLVKRSKQLTFSSYPEACNPQSQEARDRHTVSFYEDDAAIVDAFASFAETTLKNGNTLVLLATESHRASVLQTLRCGGVDISGAIESNRYIPLDRCASVSMFQVAEHFTQQLANEGKERNFRVSVA